MVSTPIDQLKAEWTNKKVKADTTVPELARFEGKIGRVVTINENGAALVDFKDGPWYDVKTEHLHVVIEED